MRPLDELWDLAWQSAVAFVIVLGLTFGLYAIVCAIGGGCRWP